MKKELEKAAKKGRYGDDRLLHVSQAEIDGLASLVPGGRLPINPDTGLPEAFFFLPFLASLAAGAAAPAAAAGAGALAAGAGLTAAAAPALAAAAPAAAGLTAAAAPAAAGLTAAAAPTLAAAAPAAATGLGALAPGAAGATGAALPTLGVSGAGGLPSMLAGTPLAGTGANLSAITPAAAGAAPAAANPVAAATGASNAITGPISTAGELASGTTASGAKFGGLGGLLGKMDLGKMLQYGALGSMLLPKGGGGGGDDDDDNKKDVRGAKYERGAQAEAPEHGGQGGTGPEFKYFPQARYYAEGGLVEGSNFSQPNQTLYWQRKGVSGNRIADVAEMAGEVKGRKRRQAEARNEREVKDMAGAAMYPKRYAEGGLASLAPDKMSSDGGDGGDEQLIDATVAALQGQAPNADAIVQQFIQTFGPDALQELIAEVKGQSQQSDGMSDSVPAQLNGLAGIAPAQLSEGEYVVPSDVVSHLGNGSSTAGERQLNDMVSRTRKARGAEKPSAIDPSQVMPA